ncbi:hypothetical protein TrVE_jg4292 [Triparma verrucosa]|uniref:Protein kinase domain-containing protein n=1 Tax=Triparma verrucosa TaxID=1606542 RepID=A0A9W7BVW6_9STRA|nr:hypothetical protein TrVE_jg4292 [Triparma verrucosa]
MPSLEDDLDVPLDPPLAPPPPPPPPPLTADDLNELKTTSDDSLSDGQKKQKRKTRVAAAVVKINGVIRDEVAAKVDAYHGRCSHAFETWKSGDGATATTMERTLKAKVIWSSKQIDGNFNVTLEHISGIDEEFDDLSGITNYRSFINGLEDKGFFTDSQQIEARDLNRYNVLLCEIINLQNGKESPDPIIINSKKADVDQLEAKLDISKRKPIIDLVEEYKIASKGSKKKQLKKHQEHLKKIEDDIIQKTAGIDWVPDRPRTTWLLLQTLFFKTFKGNNWDIKNCDCEQMMLNTMHAVYDPDGTAEEKAVYDFIKGGPAIENHGLVRKARNMAAHGEDVTVVDPAHLEQTTKEYIQSVIDFLLLMGLDANSGTKKELEALKEGNLTSVTDKDIEDIQKLYKRVLEERDKALKERDEAQKKAAKAKGQRNAVLKGAGIDAQFSTEGSQSNTWNSEKAEETVRKVAGVVEKKVEDAAEKAKNEQLEKRAAKYEKEVAKVGKKRDQGKSMTSVSAPSTDLAEFMAKKGKQDQQGKSNDADSYVLFDEDDLGDEDDAAVEKPAFKLKAGDVVEGFVFYYICEDDEQSEGSKGGQGIVKKAYTGRGPYKFYYAIKAALNPSRHRQKDEAAIYFKLDPTNEPHLAFLSDVLMRQGQPLLVLEWANEGSLGDWLKIKRKLPMKMILPKALEYAIQIVRGLRTLHIENDETSAIVHQDLKPGNILNYDDVLKIADFGLSFADDGEDENSGGSGTRGYMAPEQMLARLKKRAAERDSIAKNALADLKIIDGESSEVTTACDIWAFGLIVAQMIGEGADTAALEYIQASRRDDLQEAAKEAGSAIARLLALVADEVEAMYDSKEKNALLGVVKMLKVCLAIDASKRPSAKECEEMLQAAYKKLKGEKFKRISASATRVNERDIFSVFSQPQVRTAWFHRQVTGDMGAAVELLREQLKEEIEGLLKATGKANFNIDEAMVDAVLAEYPGWLPSVMGGWKAKDFEASFVLPVLMHLVQATCLAHDGSESLEAVERAAVLAVQAQSVWESSEGAERSCNFKTGSTDIFNSPMIMICGLVDARGGRDAVGTEKALERTVEVMLETVEENGHLAVVKLLLKHEKIDVNQATNDGGTPLYIASQQGYLAVIKLLLGARANVELTLKGENEGAENSGETALFVAAEVGHLDVLKYLIEEGKAKNIPRTDGTSPNDIAEKNGHTAVVTYLEELGDGRR